MVKRMDIGGHKLPVRLTLFALEKFEQHFEDEGFNVFALDMTKFRAKHFAYFFFVGIEAGIKATGETAPDGFGEQWVKDNIDLLDMGKITEFFGGEESDDDGKKK